MPDADDPRPVLTLPATGEAARAFQVATAARAGYGIEDEHFAPTGPLAVGGESAQ